MQKGFIYVAVGEKWINEAVFSASSLKRHYPEADITLITDKDYQHSVFNKIKIIPSQSVHSKWEAWLYRVKHVYFHSPYEQTLYLDTDTYVCSNLEPVFELLEFFDIALAPGINIIGTAFYKGKRLKSCLAYNCGVILFKKSENSEEMFRKWAKIYGEKLERYQGVLPPEESCEQVSLTEALMLSKARFFVLSNLWNAKISDFLAFRGKVNIIHGRHKDMGKIEKRINSTEALRCWDPNRNKCRLRYSDIPYYRKMMSLTRRIKLRLEKIFNFKKMIRQIARNCKKTFKKNPVFWRHFLNAGASFPYQLEHPGLSPAVAQVLESLNHDGIAILSVKDLLGEDYSIFSELTREIERLENHPDSHLELSRGRADQNDAVGYKTFIVQLLGDKVILDPQSIFARFALHPALLGVANAYFGMYTRLRHYNVWHNFTTQTAPRESQLWHQDREDYLVLKAFVYYSDVDESSGAMVYAKGTHPKGKIKCQPEYFLENKVKRTTDEQMAAAVSRDHWIQASGPKGTIVFVDTRGFHKGGLARTRDRILYNCMYTSPASESEEWFCERKTIPSGLTKAQRFALLPNRANPSS